MAYSIWTKTAGTWAELGTSATTPGIQVDSDSIRHTHNENGGPETLTFTIARDGDMAWPDLRAGQAIYCEADGVECWSGRIKRTPRTLGSVDLLTVECEGHWNALADGLVERMFTRTGTAGFGDSRSLPGVDVTNWWRGEGTVDAEFGKISIQHAQGVPTYTGTHTGMTLDLGPNARAAYISFDYASSANTSVHTWYVYGSASPIHSGGPGGQDGIAGHVAVPLNAPYYGGRTGNPFTNGGSWRYIHFYTHCVTGYTPGADVWVTFSNIFIACETAYQSGTYSNLRASDVFKWSVGSGAAANVSTDTSLIQTTPTGLPNFPNEMGYKSRRDLVESAAKYNGYQTLMTSEPVSRAVMRPRPTTPKYLLRSSDGDVTGGQSDDLSSLYNQVIVSYRSEGGPDAIVTVNSPAGNYLSNLGITRTANISVEVASLASATVLGEAFLREHDRPNFDGQVTVYGTLEQWGTGMRVPVSQVQAGDLVKLIDVTDPSTGASGRDATITNVSYSAKENAATLTLDGSKSVFDVLAAQASL